MICERCGRLLNRATGKCVCEAYGGNAPPPIATTHPLAEAERPMSVSAAVAVLNVSDRPARRETKPPPPTPPSGPSASTTGTAAPEPAPVPRPKGAPVGVVRNARLGRKRVNVVVYDGAIVVAKRGQDGSTLTAGQLVSLDPAHRLVQQELVGEVEVREDRLSGQAEIRLLRGGRLKLSWWVPRRNRGVAVENLLTSAFPAKVDKANIDMGARVLKLGLAGAIAGVALYGASLGMGKLLADEPPPPPPPPPAVTIPAAEQAARTELNGACPVWLDFVGSTPTDVRPAPVPMRKLVDGMRPRFDNAAAAQPSYVAARDEVGYLQDYSRRTQEAVDHESIARIRYAMDKVTGACEQARG